MGVFHLESGLFGEKIGPGTHNKQFIKQIVYLRYLNGDVLMNLQLPGCDVYSQRCSALV